MTNKEIEKELKKIYKEMKSWSGAKGSFADEVVNHRKLTAMK